jgi:hypothetical protein
MLTVTAQFDFFRCFLAVLTAILAIFTAFRNDAQTGRMRAFEGFGHLGSTFFFWRFPRRREVSAPEITRRHDLL